MKCWYFLKGFNWEWIINVADIKRNQEDLDSCSDDGCSSTLGRRESKTSNLSATKTNPFSAGTFFIIFSSLQERFYKFMFLTVQFFLASAAGGLCAFIAYYLTVKEAATDSKK